MYTNSTNTKLFPPFTVLDVHIQATDEYEVDKTLYEFMKDNSKMAFYVIMTIEILS